MMVKGPPQWGQCSMSISNTRLSNWAQRRRAGAEGGRASPWSANLSLALLGMICGRSLALGASTPWKRMRCSLGRCRDCATPGKTQVITRRTRGRPTQVVGGRERVENL